VWFRRTTGGSEDGEREEGEQREVRVRAPAGVRSAIARAKRARRWERARRGRALPGRAAARHAERKVWRAAEWSAMRSTGRACRRIVGLLAVLVILSHGAVAAGPASCAVAVILRGGAQAGGKTSFQCVANTAISQLGPSSDLAQGATRSVCAGCARMLCCAAVVRTPNSLPTRRVLTRRPVPPAAPATQPSKSTALALATTPCDRTHRQKRAQGARRTRCQPRHPCLRPSPPPPAALGARGWRVRTPCRGGRGAARSGGAGLG